MWRSFFEGIEDLFVNYVFKYTFDPFREMSSWWGSNVVNWALFVLGIVAFVYWMLQLKQFDDKGEEDKTITSHSYL
jgi:hypothetical protein